MQNNIRAYLFFVILTFIKFKLNFFKLMIFYINKLIHFYRK